MTHTIRLAVLSLAIGLGGVSLVQAEQQSKARGASFETLDADGNGQLTMEEMQARQLARFAAADTNGDGALSVEEIDANAPEGRKSRAERMMKRFDANSDGLLTPDEMTARPRGDRLFKRADADGNGTLSKEEFDTARAEMREHRGGKRKKSDN